MRTSASAAQDAADALEDFPLGILLPETVDVAYTYYDLAESTYTLAEVFPSKSIADDLNELGNFLAATAFFLEYGVTEEDSAEAVKGLREIVRITTSLANQIENYC